MKSPAGGGTPSAPIRLELFLGDLLGYELRIDGDFGERSHWSFREGCFATLFGPARATPLHHRACKAQMTNGFYPDLDKSSVSRHFVA